MKFQTLLPACVAAVLAAASTGPARAALIEIAPAAGTSSTSTTTTTTTTTTTSSGAVPTAGVPTFSATTGSVANGGTPQAPGGAALVAAGIPYLEYANVNGNFELTLWNFIITISAAQNGLPLIVAQGNMGNIPGGNVGTGVVPLPASGWLFASGLVGGALALRRRRQGPGRTAPAPQPAPAAA
jgi:hypothetical protein